MRKHWNKQFGNLFWIFFTIFILKSANRKLLDATIFKDINCLTIKKLIEVNIHHLKFKFKYLF
jgi:hypothetical protein